MTFLSKADALQKLLERYENAIRRSLKFRAHIPQPGSCASYIRAMNSRADIAEKIASHMLGKEKRAELKAFYRRINKIEEKKR